jgi:riboflavin kinase/FMN adenylyltransferase
MRVVRDYQFTKPEDRGACAAIGNFDGVHLGHQAVIAIARDHADRLGALLGVVTFEPHPRAFFAPDAAPFRLMNAEARAHRLEKLGIDILYELNFNTALSGLSAEAFAADVLAGGLGLRHAVVGADFRFGKGRAGDVAALQRFGRSGGFSVTEAPLVSGSQGAFSSTAIRKALADGRPGDAAAMLGHWHRIEGPVIRGDQRGRVLGYPTANMALDGLHVPRFGVYAVLVDVLSGPWAGHYHGAASLGVRPMFGENAPNLEVFLFDFAGDLYGTHLSVALVDFQRPEERFDSVDALTARMARDCAQARATLAALPA